MGEQLLRCFGTGCFSVGRGAVAIEPLCREFVIAVGNAFDGLTDRERLSLTFSTVVRDVTACAKFTLPCIDTGVVAPEVGAGYEKGGIGRLFRRSHIE